MKPMNTLKHLLLGATLIALPFGFSAKLAHAANLTDKLDEVQAEAEFGDRDLTDTVGQLINVFLGLLGIIFLVLVIYAGFLWMTSAGDEKKVGTAKNILISAVVGLVVLLSAYAISSFVIEQLSSATGTG
jgi:hypothetical protein